MYFTIPNQSDINRYDIRLERTDWLYYEKLNVLIEDDRELIFTYLDFVYQKFPMFFSDFETGDHGWSLANGTETNQWHIGNALSYSGQRSIYISNDFGESHAITPNNSSRVHFYKSIDFPDNAKNIELSFIYQNNYGRLSVFLSQTRPIGGWSAWGDFEIWFVPLSTTWRDITYSIPDSFAGTRRYLIFSWNWFSEDALLPPAIDNITLTYFAPWVE
jgi:hypothetical protein